MRITSGQYGGRPIQAPKGRDTRPTSDKVRQAVFNMLDHRGVVAGSNVFDGFCGTGALGLEALSRGAEHAVFVDFGTEALKSVNANIVALGVQARTTTMRGDMARLKPRPQDLAPCDLVFLDPPYGKGLLPRALKALTHGGWLSPDAEIVAECEADFEVPPSMPVEQDRQYGQTRILVINAGDLDL